MSLSTLDEILDYFSKEETNPGDHWAFAEDDSSLGVDYSSNHTMRDKNKVKFWLDINRDGTISIFWKPSQEAKGQTWVFKEDVI